MKTFKEFTEDREFQQFCENINEDFAEKVLNKVGSVSRFFKQGWKQVFKSKGKVAKDPQELVDIVKKNEKLINSVKEDVYDDGGTTVDFGKVIETIIDKTQNIPVLAKQHKQLLKRANDLKNDSKLKQAIKVVFTNQYIKNKSLEDRVAYAWIILVGRINFDSKPMSVKSALPV